MKDQERDDLFARARGGVAPTDDDRRRVRAALGRKLGIAAGASVGVTAAKAAASVVPAVAPTGSAAVAGVGFSSLAVGKALAVVVAVAAVGWAAVPARHLVVPVDHASVTASAPVAPSRADPPVKANPLSPSVIEVPVTPSPEPVARDRSPDPVTLNPPVAPAPTSVPVLPLPPAVVTSPADDLALVKEMQVALRDGDEGRALALVRDHERRFPASVLAPEREGVRVLAVCSRAVPVEAQQLGQGFLDTHPLSPLAARVRIACQLPR